MGALDPGFDEPDDDDLELGDDEQFPFSFVADEVVRRPSKAERKAQKRALKQKAADAAEHDQRYAYVTIVYDRTTDTVAFDHEWVSIAEMYGIVTRAWARVDGHIQANGED